MSNVGDGNVRTVACIGVYADLHGNHKHLKRGGFLLFNILKLKENHYLKKAQIRRKKNVFYFLIQNFIHEALCILHLICF